jgi:hypothetical protein
VFGCLRLRRRGYIGTLGSSLMHRPLAILGLGVALLLTTGCGRIAEISYPGLNTNVPQDMYMDASEKRFLWICLNTTNLVGVQPRASFLTDSRGRRYRLEFDTRAIHDNQLKGGRLVQSQYNIRAYSLDPSPKQLDFDSGFYSISLSYTNDGSPKGLVINRQFVINRRLIFTPWWLFKWAIHGD